MRLQPGCSPVASSLAFIAILSCYYAEASLSANAPVAGPPYKNPPLNRRDIPGEASLNANAPIEGPPYKNPPLNRRDISGEANFNANAPVAGPPYKNPPLNRRDISGEANFNANAPVEGPPYKNPPLNRRDVALNNLPVSNETKYPRTPLARRTINGGDQLSVETGSRRLERRSPHYHKYKKHKKHGWGC